MPAIELTRLRTKIELLSQSYNSPRRFVKELTEFYQSYSDLTFQPGNLDPTAIVHPAFRTPVLFNHLVEQAFVRLPPENPESTLETIDLLWQVQKLELRQLAAALMGSLPCSCCSQVLERIRKWSTVYEDRGLIAFLHQKGTETLRREQPGLWIDTLKEWSQTTDPYLQKLAIQGLIPLVDDQDFNNLPLIFDLLYPLLRSLDQNLIFQLESALKAIAKRSEVETVYFLKQVIRSADEPILPRFIRRNLSYFSPASQNSLKLCLRENLEHY
jgi:hypothetical protein